MKKKMMVLGTVCIFLIIISLCIVNVHEMKKTIFNDEEFKTGLQETLDYYRKDNFITINGIDFEDEECLIDFLKYEHFEYNFMEYRSEIRSEYEKILAEANEKDIMLKMGQIYYMIANNLTIDEIQKKEAFNYEVPVNKNNLSKMPLELIAVLNYIDSNELKQNTETLKKLQNEMAAYEIKKEIIFGDYKESVDLYSDEDEKVRYFVTSNGMVFTLPGLKVKQNDDTVRYYINDDYYYVVSNDTTIIEDDKIVLNKPIKYSDLKKFEPIKVGKDKIYYNTTISRAAFYQDFYDYALEFLNYGSDKIYSWFYENNIGEQLNEAQFNYLAAQKIDLPEDAKNVIEWEVPEGYIIPEKIQEVLKITDNEDNHIVAYPIADNKNEKFKHASEYTFYGNYNGKEQHFVTSTGIVFTIPGLVRKEDDGTLKCYIVCNFFEGSYYILSNSNSNKDGEIYSDKIITGEDFKELYGIKK